MHHEIGLSLCVASLSLLGGYLWIAFIMAVIEGSPVNVYLKTKFRKAKPTPTTGASLSKHLEDFYSVFERSEVSASNELKINRLFDLVAVISRFYDTRELPEKQSVLFCTALTEYLVSPIQKLGVLRFEKAKVKRPLNLDLSDRLDLIVDAAQEIVNEVYATMEKQITKNETFVQDKFAGTEISVSSKETVGV